MADRVHVEKKHTTSHDADQARLSTRLYLERCDRSTMGALRSLTGMQASHVWHDRHIACPGPALVSFVKSRFKPERRPSTNREPLCFIQR